MNLLGKLFIVMIFIGSIVLASFTVVLHSTHKNWREEANNLSATLQTLTQELADLQRQRDAMVAALELQIRTEAARNISLSEQIRRLTQENEEAKREVARLMEEEAEKRAQVATANLNIQLLREQLEGVTGALRDAQIEWMEMSTELVRQMDEAHGLAIQLTNYRTTASNLAEEFRSAMEVLRLFGLQPDPALYPAMPPAGVRGVITEVRQPGGWVEISIGTDSGLARGHQLDVVRTIDGRTVLVGKIEVVDPIADRASARIIPEFRLGVVQRGDEVKYIQVSGMIAVH